MLNLKSWPMSMPGSKRRMIEKLWPNIPRPRPNPECERCIGRGFTINDTDGKVWPAPQHWIDHPTPSQPLDRCACWGRFVVPFFGTGVDSAHFRNQGFRIVASDAQPLIVAMHNDFTRVIELSRRWTAAVGTFPVEAQKAAYFELRDRHRQDPQAWSFYTLNKHAHSQLVRHNRKGDFNAPFGRISKLPTAEVVAAHVEFIASIDGPKVMDFAEAMRAAQPGDVAYLDPPYYGTFDGYTGQPFDTPRLLSEMVKVRDRGIDGAMSNSLAVLDLLAPHGLIIGENVDVHHYTRAGTVNSDAKKRQPVAEVLVVWKGRP